MIQMVQKHKEEFGTPCWNEVAAAFDASPGSCQKRYKIHMDGI